MTFLGGENLYFRPAGDANNDLFGRKKPWKGPPQGEKDLFSGAAGGGK